MNEKETNRYKLQIKLITDKNIDLQQKIDKAIEVLKLCNSKCSKEVIEILRGDDNE